MTLDPRQRAMLLEMGVRVWLPDAVADGDAAAGAGAGADADARARGNGASARTAVAPKSPLPPPVRRQAPDGNDAQVGARAASSSPAPIGTPAVAQERANAITRMDWPALQQSVSGCTACALCESRRNTVFGVGQAAPVDWLVVGEAPGENEDMQGEPFVGAAGKLLDNMLKSVGLDRRRDAGDSEGEGDSDNNRARQKVFITNVLKCRPPGNRNPQPAEMAQCTPYLARQIELLQPRVILALGRFAVQTLLAPTVPDVQTQPLGKLRGKVYRWQAERFEVPVVVSYHPAYLLRSLPDKAKAWADLCLALKVLKQAPTS